jgi:hypothetical protein
MRLPYYIMPTLVNLCLWLLLPGLTFGQTILEAEDAYFSSGPCLQNLKIAVQP